MSLCCDTYIIHSNSVFAALDTIYQQAFIDRRKNSCLCSETPLKKISNYFKVTEKTSINIKLSGIVGLILLRKQTQWVVFGHSGWLDHFFLSFPYKICEAQIARMALPAVSQFSMCAHMCREDLMHPSLLLEKIHGCAAWSVWTAHSQLVPSFQRENLEDLDHKPDKLLQRWEPKLCWYFWEELTSSTRHLIECKSRIPTRKTGVMIIVSTSETTAEANSPWFVCSRVATWKRRSRMQTGLALWGCNTVCGSKLSTLVAKNLSRCLLALFCYYSSVSGGTAPHCCC